MFDINSLGLLLILITYAAIGVTGWALYRHTNLFPTFSKFFAIIIIVGLVILSLAFIKFNTSDLSMPRNFVNAFGSGGIVCMFKWPAGIALTEDEKKRIGRRIREAKGRAHKDCRIFDLTPHFIVELFLKQGGRCYFTRKLMTWMGNDLNTVSISRLDPDGNYTTDNTVLTCLVVANMRNSYSYETTLKYCKAVVNHALPLDDMRLFEGQEKDRHLISRRQSIDINPMVMGEKAGMSERNKDERKPRCKNKQTPKDREEDREFAAKFLIKKCTFCDRYLPLDCFYKRPKSNPGPDGLEARCKDCDRKRALEQSVGLTSLLKEKVTGAKIRSRQKGQNSTLTFDMALTQLNVQGGLCYYTSIPLTGEPGNLDNVSIDRLDSMKPYTMDNVVLCCEAINIMKNEMSYKDFVDYCRAIVDNSLPLDDPRLLTRPNESIGGKLRKEALERKPEFDDVKIERHGISGFSAGCS